MTQNQYSKLFSASSFTSLIMRRGMKIWVHDIGNKYVPGEAISLSIQEKASEEYIISIMRLFFTINEYIKELIASIRFIEVDRNKIKSLYGSKISQEEYFKYHYDSIVIKLVTSLDLCAKMGNLVYNLGIEEKKCSCHQFLINKKMVNTKPQIQLTQFSAKIDKLKNYRHQKVHQSKTAEDNIYDGIVFDWDELNLFFNEPLDEAILNSVKFLAENDIRNSKKIIKKDIKLTIINVFLFLDTLTEKVEENIGITVIRKTPSPAFHHNAPH